MKIVLTIVLMWASIGCTSLDYAGQESATKCVVGPTGKVQCIDRKLYNDNFRR